MATVVDLEAKVRFICSANGWQRAQLAKRVGLSAPSLSRCLREGKIRRSVYEKINLLYNKSLSKGRKPKKQIDLASVTLEELITELMTRLMKIKSL